MKPIRQLTVITTAQPGLGAYFKRVGSFRSLVLTLALRDLKVKYTQTFLGIIWVVVQPLTGLLIFSFFFDKLIKVNTGGIPYPLFAFSGLLSWTFFSAIISNAGTSLLESQDLIRKISFPTLVLPLAKVLVDLVDLAIGILLLFGVMVILGRFPGWPIVFLPVMILFNIGVGLSVAIWLSALTIRYRDFRHIIPYLINFGIWLTPVFFPDTLIPTAYRWILYLNPMAATIAGLRWSLVGAPLPPPDYFVSALLIFFLLLTGLYFFIKIESDVSDYL
jgi:lipopolysaccharide transport system permease protein